MPNAQNPVPIDFGPSAMLVRVYRVAKALDVSKKRIYQMVREGKLSAVRLGPRSMRITRDSIDDFLSRGQNEFHDRACEASGAAPQPPRSPNGRSPDHF